ncbi:hypothetical protein BDR04DRAFT_1116463 [Suillus decipiens]|nr:hypothetical protein BDR04DRAFT_1116463 [Suillus decipiens]
MFGILVTDDNVCNITRLARMSFKTPQESFEMNFLLSTVAEPRGRASATFAARSVIAHEYRVQRKDFGDFWQVGPIVSGAGAGEAATLAASVKSSTLWHSILILRPKTAIRTMKDLQFTASVDRIGEHSGIVNEKRYKRGVLTGNTKAGGTRTREEDFFEKLFGLTWSGDLTVGFAVDTRVYMSYLY